VAQGTRGSIGQQRNPETGGFLKTGTDSSTRASREQLTRNRGAPTIASVRLNDAWSEINQRCDFRHRRWAWFSAASARQIAR